MTIKWDPKQYGRFEEARSRPFFDLLRRVDHPDPKRIVDLGCGTGHLTACLADRWRAYVLGVDSSPDMLAAAKEHAIPGRLEFQLADISTWRRAEPCDIVISNAALQWVPNHLDVLHDISTGVKSGGVIAFQVPGNFESPSHKAIYEVCSQPKWKHLICDITRPVVHDPETYLESMMDWGFLVDAWETTYIHLLQSEKPVLEWVKGTALRPALARLDPGQQTEFLSEIGARLLEAYPAGRHGTILPFRRIFVVATRS